MWQQRIYVDGNWLRQTDGKIQDKAIEREAEALGNTETFPSHTKTVDDHWTESVGGFKKIGLERPHLKKLKPTQLAVKITDFHLWITPCDGCLFLPLRHRKARFHFLGYTLK